eukprot:8550204-Lingulodinium_polyedra.AAC.1
MSPAFRANNSEAFAPGPSLPSSLTPSRTRTSRCGRTGSGSSPSSGAAWASQPGRAWRRLGWRPRSR